MPSSSSSNPNNDPPPNDPPPEYSSLYPNRTCQICPSDCHCLAEPPAAPAVLAHQLRGLSLWTAYNQLVTARTSQTSLEPLSVEGFHYLLARSRARRPTDEALDTSKADPPTTDSEMSAFESLTEEQQAILANVQDGDLVYVVARLTGEDQNDMDLSGDPAASEAGDADVNEEEGSEVEAEAGSDGEVEDEDESGEAGPDGEVEDEDESGEATHTDGGASETSSNAASDGASDSDDEWPEPDISGTMYVVSGVVKDSKSDKIIDLQLTEMTYSPNVNPGTGKHEYSIDGASCLHNHTTACQSGLCDAAQQLNAIVVKECIIEVNPTADKIRPLVTEGSQEGFCIRDCDEGFLVDLSNLPNLVQGFAPLTDIPDELMATVCPVCTGSALLQQQQQMQRLILNRSQCDIGAIVEWLGQLNVRRRVLGYEFCQLDEREWNFYFDDMQNEDEDEDGADQDGGRWEQWDEVMDPNTNIVTRPATDEAVDALPRMIFSKGETGEGDETCVICQSDFEEGEVQIQLPCNHRHFHEECTKQWLKQFANCPTCRAEIAPPEHGEEEQEQNGGQDTLDNPMEGSGVYIWEDTREDGDEDDFGGDSEDQDQEGPDDKEEIEDDEDEEMTDAE